MNIRIAILISYVRGKLGEDRWLRDFDTVGYVALEFATPDRQTAVTAGVCIEASPKASAERTHFLLSEPLDPTLLVPDGKNGLSRRELKKTLKKSTQGQRLRPRCGQLPAGFAHPVGEPEPDQLL